MNQKIPIQIDIDPESVNIFSNNLKLLVSGIEKASNNKIFNDEEFQSLCLSINNIGNLVLLLAKSIEKTIDKAENIKQKNSYYMMKDID